MRRTSGVAGLAKKRAAGWRCAEWRSIKPKGLQSDGCGQGRRDGCFRCCFFDHGSLYCSLHATVTPHLVRLQELGTVSYKEVCT
jgi:hypothetical protein